MQRKFAQKYSSKIVSLLVSIVVLLSFFGDIPKARATFPVISDVASGSVTSVSAIITWTTDIASNSLVDYGLTTAYGYTSGDAINLVTDHSIEITGLVPGTPYRFRVRSADSTGDESSDDNSGFGFTFTTVASPVISNVHLADLGNNYVTIDWQTDVAAYPYVAYGATDNYGKLVGDEETAVTSHSISLAGLTLGNLYHYKPRVKDIYGNFTYYGSDNVFTVGSPHLQSFTSSTSDETYGPASAINITANYSENLATGSTITVVLNTGASVTLDTITDSTKLTGTYTVGATGSGQNTNDLTVSSVTSQNSCDSNSYCNTSTTLPTNNLAASADLAIDTTAPDFSAVLPVASSSINSVTTTSDISYTLSETIENGTIMITQTGGSGDGNSPHTCTLTSAALSSGAHNNFDTTACSGGAITLVDGAIYTFTFDGEDAPGNAASTITRTSVTFDISSPILQSFTSTTTDGTYGPTANINITANYSENLASGSTATVVLDTGASVTLDTITDNTKLTGSYTVGATGSGQNTSDLLVSSLTSQNSCDGAGNCQIGTDVPGTNINAGSELVIDTIAPTAPTSVLFVTDPINSTNTTSTTLRIIGEINSTIYYSIDDTDGGTSAVTGNIAMEGDGSTDVTNINLSGLTDGTLTGVAYLRDAAGNNSGNTQDTVTKDTTNPTFTIQYYSDAELTNSLGDNPHLKAGIYYLKIISGETLNATPTISFDAQGSANDINDATTSFVSGTDYTYTRTIASDVAADGTALETITITGTDAFGNTANAIAPSDAGTKAAYTDTIKPTVSGSVLPVNAKAGSVTVDLTFDENANQLIAPTVVLRKQDSSTLPVTGSFTGPTTWSGTATVAPSDANGTTTLEVSFAADLAGNVMNANNNVTTFTIDTTNPILIINSGVDVGPTKNDTINITTSDTGSGVTSQFHGFSSDATCDTDDTIDTAFVSGSDFVISGDHTDYLCSRAIDNAGNIGYQLVGQLNVDNSVPTITSVSSMVSDERYNANDVIDINVVFSEAVTSAEVLITLETGTTDRTCTFSISDSDTGSCNYIVQAGDISEDLDTKSISGTINDQAGNTMVDFTPDTNLADNKDLIIDTTSPIVNIISPLNGNHVNGDVEIFFSDDDTTDPQCSLDNTNWVTCSSGVTTLADLTDWVALSDGLFTLYLRDTDLAGNIGTDNETGIIKDTDAPRIQTVSSNHDNGRFNVGEIIDIDITFSRNVTSTENVDLYLETGSNDRFCTFSVTDSNIASCDYTVQPTDMSDDLAIKFITPVVGNITDQVGNEMTNFTPITNLDENKDIIIDTLGATITNVTSGHDNGVFGIDEEINIGVTFSEIVTSDGFVTITLDTGGSCTFTLTNSTDGSCNYVVDEGENSTDLNVSAISGTINDQIGNSMTNFVPATNLSANKEIVIDTTLAGNPTITNITSSKDDGAYKAGEIIPIELTFSEAITTNGDVTVTLETGATDRTCTFNASNSTTASCNYVVEAGDISSDLEVSLVSGVIADQASNPMIDFTPLANLAYNKNIVIDTTNPDAPVVTLLDPINDANKNSATITGTGEANTSVNYSIDDVNGNTSAKTGSGSVDGSGNINITNINLTGLDGGTLTATVYLTDIAGNSGTVGTDDATSSVALPTITSISSDKDNRSYSVGTVIDIDFTFSESVTSNGNVTVTLETGTNDRSCTFQVTDSDTASCNYVVQANDASLDLDVLSVSGTILDGTSNPMADFIPLTNLAANKDIIIDTTILSLVSFTSATIDGSYGPLSTINITATYSEALTVGSNISLSLSSGATIVLDTIVNNDTLSGTYTVGTAGSGENTNDLSVSEITEHNSCDLALNCISGTTLPGINIADGSNILIDALSPIFSEVMPLNSSNIDSVTSASDISYTLSESLASGSIVITRTAWELDPNSPHTCTLSGAHLASGQHENFDTANCVEGAITLVTGAVYTFDFNGEDAFGNHATEVSKTGISFGLDNIPPVISDVLVTNITSSSATITWDTDESSNSLVDYGTSTAYGETKGDANADTTTHSVEISDLLPGTDYLLRVRSMDASDNTALDDNSGAGYAFATLDMPTISNIDVTALTSDNATINWDTSANVYGYVEYGVTTSYGKVIGDEDTLKNDHTIDLPGLFAETTYHFRIRIKDTYGNYSVSGDETFETLVNADDNDPPVITNVAVSSITSARATFTWTTDEPASSFVEYGKTTSYGEKYGNDILATDHSITLPASLDGETLYHFRVASSDSARNESVSSDETFTTLTGSSDSDPASGGSSSNISGIKISDITSSTAMVQWKTNQVCNGIVRYGLDKEYGYSTAEDTTIGSLDKFEKNHAVLLTNLLSNTKYNYQVISYDTVGNISVSGNKTFSTSDLSSISKVTIESVTLTSAVILWETGEPTNSELEYGLSTNYGQVQKNSKLSNFHRVELKNLANDQTYHFRIKGKIENSGLISSDDYVFATYPKPEVQKYELKEVTDYEATISWNTNIPTESSVEYLNINNPEDKGSQGFPEASSTHELTIIGLEQGSEYEMKIKGVDINKNAFESSPFTVKTQKDITPPVISNINTESSLVNKKENQVQSIIFWKTDEPATSQVFFDIGMNRAEGYGQSSKEDTNLTTNHLVVLPDLKPGLVYRFKVASKDKNENLQESDTYSLLTPRRDQSVIQLIIANFEQTFGWMKNIKLNK